LTYFPDRKFTLRKGLKDYRQERDAMIDEKLARLRIYRSNIHRYRRLLQTQLTELERQFIERRLSEEVQAARWLSDHTFPFALLPVRQSTGDDPLLSAENWNWIDGELRPPIPHQRITRKGRPPDGRLS
jgi:hypothetical protein